MNPPCMLFKNLCFIFGVVMLSPSQVMGWEVILQEKNLRVQQRNYPGSDLNEIRGVVRVQASLNSLMALLKDAHFNQQWVYRSGGATILEENGYTQAYVYGVVDAPWPMQDRDTVVRFDYRQHAASKIITIDITNFPDFIAERDEYVRVPDFGGYWQLRPEEDGWVEVTYQVYGDPGGMIPVWLANYAAVRSVTKTLENMGPAVKRYQSAHSSIVQEAFPD